MKTDDQSDTRMLTYNDVYCQVATALAEDFGILVPLFSRKYGMDEDELVRATAVAAINSGIFWQLSYLGLAAETVNRVTDRVYDVICDAIVEHESTTEQK
jgi:hypothetical protein